MTSLTTFTSPEGIELVIDTITGEAFATQAGYARMSGVEYSTVRKRVERLRGTIGLETSEMSTIQGIQTVTLLPAEVVLRWLMKDNPDLALQMGIAGASMYIYFLAGYKLDSPLIKVEKPKVPMLRDPNFSEVQTRLEYAHQQYEFWVKADRLDIANLWADSIVDCLKNR